MSHSVILRDARVVDARGVVAERADIRIDDGMISAIGSCGTRADRDLDVGGRTVTPALMNAHVHMCLDGSADPMAAWMSESDIEAARRAVPRLHRMLANGVTTVRDLGGRMGVTTTLGRLIASGWLTGPRLVAAGLVVTSPGGHGHWMGIEIAGADEARMATRRLIEGGAGVIKVMATAGMMTPGQSAGDPQLTTEEIRACVEEAHAAGLAVAAHVEGRVGGANAIEAGVDSIEHGHGLDDDLIDRMAADGIVLVPTISCDRAMTRLGADAGIPAHMIEDCTRLAPSLEWALQRAIAAGVEIAAGNDGGAPLTRGEDVVDELEVYVEMGMDPLSALATATTNTARLLRLPDVGLVAAGQRADLIVARDDPLETVRALRHPDVVVAGGRVIDPRLWIGMSDEGGHHR